MHPARLVLDGALISQRDRLTHLRRRYRALQLLELSEALDTVASIDGRRQRPDRGHQPSELGGRQRSGGHP